MTMADAPETAGGDLKARVQRVGGYLAAMVMPNIGAFIAWGLITALFIPTGWLPNKHFAELVDPTINVLLPILIGYTGGRMVHGQRGGVVGAVATVGVVVGSGIPMFLGAMVMGPLAAAVIKQIDEFTGRVTRPGFEMLVDNFTAGIVGAAGAILGIWGVGPVVRRATTAAGTGVAWLIHHHLLPLASVVIEPAKVLFLNNAVNHGVLGPLGVAEATRHGQSILFMLEANPGPASGCCSPTCCSAPGRCGPACPPR
jgi:PTS system mannitol-specific IIC component